MKSHKLPKRRGKGYLLETISSPNTNRILDQYQPFPTTICRAERRFSKLPVVTAPKELTFDYHGLQSRSRSKWLRNLKNLIQWNETVSSDFWAKTRTTNLDLDFNHGFGPRKNMSFPRGKAVQCKISSYHLVWCECKRRSRGLNYFFLQLNLCLLNLHRTVKYNILRKSSVREWEVLHF